MRLVFSRISLIVYTFSIKNILSMWQTYFKWQKITSLNWYVFFYFVFKLRSSTKFWILFCCKHTNMFCFKNIITRFTTLPSLFWRFSTDSILLKLKLTNFAVFLFINMLRLFYNGKILSQVKNNICLFQSLLNIRCNNLLKQSLSRPLSNNFS